MDRLGVTQALPDKVQVPLRSRNPLGGFFLKRMEDVQHALEANGVDGAVSVAIEIVSNLKDVAAKALEGLRVRRMISQLRFEQGLADLPPDSCRKRLQVSSAGANEDRRLDRAQEIDHPFIVISL